jgi:ADP-L-glycero-D-manno-heptose 6-epimerase
MYVITGGAGFIGSNVAHALAGRGARVVIVDRLCREEKWRNLAACDIYDIVKPDALADWLDRHRSEVETVVHMGAIASTMEPDVDLIAETNFRLSCLLWHWCSQQQKRFLYASSAAIYGGGELGFDDSDTSSKALARLRPLNAYGWSKLLFDRWVARQVEAGKEPPPQWVGLRFFNVYGPHEYHKQGMQSVVAHAYRQATSGTHINLYRSHRPDCADGRQMRDFIYVTDCVEVVLWFLGQPRLSGLFNCGTGVARTFLDLAQAVFAALGRTMQVEFVDMPAAIKENYQYFTQANLGRLRGVGYVQPFTSLENGVEDYVKRFLARANRYR